MNKLNFIINTTNCLSCKFFKDDKCNHENAEENEENFYEIKKEYEENPSSFTDDFKDNNRKYYVCIKFQYIHD